MGEARVFILGFCYMDSDSELTGIIIDMYRIYKMTSPLKRYIYTDWKVNETTMYEQIGEAFDGDIIDQDIFDFADKIRQERRTTFVNKGPLLIHIRKAVKEGPVLIYFSGHAENGNLLLPDKSSLSTHELKRELSLGSKDWENIVIYDCCDNCSMCLPFRVAGGSIRLSGMNPEDIIMPRIACLWSGSRPNDTFSTYTGSIFTEALYQSVIEMREFLTTKDGEYGHIIMQVRRKMENSVEKWSRISKDVPNVPPDPKCEITHPDMKRLPIWLLLPNIEHVRTIMQDGIVRITIVPHEIREENDTYEQYISSNHVQERRVELHM